MKKKRLISFLLTLCMLVALFSGMTTVSASSGKNTGTRHALCTALSSQAVAYYTGDYAFDKLAALPGSSSGSSLASMDSQLFQTLHTLMDTTMTNRVTYKSLTTYWPDTDATGGSSTNVLVYSDVVTDSSISREHVWPKSRASYQESNGGSDLHHLRPENANVNSTRSNHTMGNTRSLSSSYQTCSYGGSTVLWYDTGYGEKVAGEQEGLVEVNDNIKGDVARILLYVYVRWEQPNLFENVASQNLPANDSGSSNNGLKVIEDLDTLLQWCEMDPVDTWEMSRNDCIEDIQGNRNVFIDYPELAWLLFNQELPDMKTPSGYAEENQGPAYTITAKADDASHGSVAVSGKTVTATPAEGYYVSGCSLSPADAATVRRNGNSFHLSNVTADCELTVIFAEKAPATLTFVVPEGVTCPAQNVYLNDTIKLPAPSGTPADKTQDYSFAGWVSAPVADTTTKPEFLKADSSYTVTASEAFYALYTYTVADSTGSSDAFNLAKTMSEGSYVVVAPEASVMMNNTVTNTYLGMDTAIIEADTVTNAAATNVFTFRSVGDYYAIFDTTGAALTCSGAKKVSLDAEKTEVTEADTAYLWSVSIDDSGTATLTPYTSDYGRLQYNSSSPRFTTYTSTQKSLALYGGTPSVRHYLTLEGATPRPCDHAWGEGVVTTQPTCTQAGVKTYTCSKCNETKTEEIAPLGHIDENTDGKCDRCGEEISVCSHDWGTGTVTTAATYSAPGVMTYTCGKCGETKTAEIPALALPFVDVKDTDYFRAPVAWALDNAITYGDDETHFAPQSPCTREQVVTFLWRASGKPAPKSETCPFVDVKPTDYSYDAVRWAAEQGITMGTDDTHFSPKATVTRAQFVSFLWRADGKPEAGTENTFTDLDENEYYVPAVLWAVEKQITVGTGNGKFSPDAPCLREQVVTFLYRDR